MSDETKHAHLSIINGGVSGSLPHMAHLLAPVEQSARDRDQRQYIVSEVYHCSPGLWVIERRAVAMSARVVRSTAAVCVAALITKLDAHVRVAGSVISV
jgi:hypothetical protein